MKLKWAALDKSKAIAATSTAYKSQKNVPTTYLYNYKPTKPLKKKEATGLLLRLSKKKPALNRHFNFVFNSNSPQVFRLAHVTMTVRLVGLGLG